MVPWYRTSGSKSASNTLKLCDLRVDPENRAGEARRARALDAVAELVELAVMAGQPVA